ncbi:hypothetical protein LJC22_06640 [Desulfosarcina sp. OttesenSCG-928-G10]|nr:hypothetical protein [Desulfosarcina sp. OttesenSCG-928-G10]
MISANSLTSGFKPFTCKRQLGEKGEKRMIFLCAAAFTPAPDYHYQGKSTTHRHLETAMRHNCRFFEKSITRFAAMMN